MLNKLNGKNVFIFDIETTGLPKSKNGNGKNNYHYFNENDKYDSSRIVSIAWLHIENFTIDKLNCDNINHYIRKPVNFKICNSEFHNISNEQALNEGTTFIDILNKYGLKKDLLNSDILIAHNCLFDFNILLNELHRIKSIQLLIKLTTMYDKNDYLCTGEYSKNICKIPMKSFGFKMPKLSELYNYCYHENFNNQHNAQADLIALVNIIKRLCQLKK